MDQWLLLLLLNSVSRMDVPRSVHSSRQASGWFLVVSARSALAQSCWGHGRPFLLGGHLGGGAAGSFHFLRKCQTFPQTACTIVGSHRHTRPQTLVNTRSCLLLQSLHGAAGATITVTVGPRG